MTLLLVGLIGLGRKRLSGRNMKKIRRWLAKTWQF
jgi:hypothetical protein